MTQKYNRIVNESVLQEIPVAGYDTWFKLEPRSSASKVQGECHLILKCFTSQVFSCTIFSLVSPREELQLVMFVFYLQRDTALSKRDTNVSIHKKLLSQIVEYEHAQVKVSSVFMALPILFIMNSFEFRATAFSLLTKSWSL